MNTLLRRALALAVLLCLSLTAFGQGSLTIEEALSGSELPAKLKIADLGPEFKAVSLDGGGANSAYTSLFGFGMMGMSAEMRPLGYMAISWTKFDKVTIEGKRYLAVYRASVTSATGFNLLPEVRLVLVNLETIREISYPDASFTLEDFKKLASGTATTSVEGNESKTLSNAKQLVTGFLIYLADYDDIAPYVQGTDQLFRKLQPYLKSTDAQKTLNPAGGRFLFNMALAGVSQTDVPNPADTVAFYESAPWPDGKRVVAFADGHAKLLDEAEWKKASQTLNLKLKKSGKPLKASE